MNTLNHSTQRLKVMADSARLRLYKLVLAEELTVAELTHITQLAQSRVSTHLGKLREAGLIQDRRAGKQVFYKATLSTEGSADTHWQEWVQNIDDAHTRRDQAQLHAVLQQRTTGRWADQLRGGMEAHYSPGRTWEATTRALVPLLQLCPAPDIGCGHGWLAPPVAPQAPQTRG